MLHGGNIQASKPSLSETPELATLELDLSPFLQTAG